MRDIITILDPFNKFKPSSVLRNHRRVTVDDLVEPIQGYKWAVILNEAYWNADGIDEVIGSFKALVDKVDMSDELSCLEAARQSGRLTEGRKAMPLVVVNCLQETGLEPFWIRSFEGAERKRITAQQMTEDMFDIMEDGYGELEVCDADARWYLRFRDDDALLFLFAESSLIDKIKANIPENILGITGSFVYAY